MFVRLTKCPLVLLFVHDPAQHCCHALHRLLVQIDAIRMILLMTAPVSLLEASSGTRRDMVEVLVVTDETVVAVL